jgi:hypothetical protein
MARQKGSRSGRCQGCNHLERVRIERLLAAGASIKAAARKFGIDYHALRRRHRIGGDRRRRRDLIALVGSTAVSWLLVAHAQPREMPVVGNLNLFSRPPPPWEPGQGPVADELREAGYVAGQNVTVEYCFAEGAL